MEVKRYCFMFLGYYIINLFFVVGLSTALLIYLGRFSPQNPKTGAFQRLLMGVICWAFYDLTVTYARHMFPQGTAFDLYRSLSFMFLVFPPAAGELILSLIRKVTWRQRIWLYSPFALLYIIALLAPDLVSARTFDISGGYDVPSAPWNLAFKIYTLCFSVILLIRLFLDAGADPDIPARKEKRVLFMGGMTTMAGMMAAQVFVDKIGPNFPWMANLATSFTTLSAFWGLKRYGRVLSPRAVYETTVQISPNGLIHLQDGRILWANQSMSGLLGLNDPDLLSRLPVADILDPGTYTREGVKDIVDRIEKGLVRGEELSLKGPGDGPILCLAYSRPFEKARLDRGVLAVFTDITERKRVEREKRDLEKKLAHSQRMEALGLLAGGVAHDLNNVLSGIVSYPELLLMDLPQDSSLRKPILTIRDSGRKAATIVEDLLTLARRGVRTKEVLNLNDIVSGYLESPEYEKLKSYYPGVEMIIDLEKDLMNINGSPFHLKKALMNLVSNAAEAQPDGGKILISTKNRYVEGVIQGCGAVQKGHYAVLRVEDGGIGIDPEDLKHIFEPFYTKKVMGRSGTGLGMAVVWGTAQDHEGYIDMSSTPGVGTTFDLYFPVTEEPIVRQSSPAPIESYRGRGETILIVDDIREQREIASRMLGKLGYSVASAPNGEQAVEYMKEHSADLLVLDMIMDPGIDGLETYRKILEFHPSQKALIASGFSETDRVREAQRLGAGAYVKKPYDLEKIGMAVRKELDHSPVG